MKRLRISPGSISIVLLVTGMAVAIVGIVIGRQASTTPTNTSSSAQLNAPAPTLLSVTGDMSSITLTWQDNATNETDFALMKGGVFTGITAPANATSLTTLTYSCLANNGQQFSISARNSAGSGTSASLPLTCATPPSAPTLLSVTGTDTSVTLTWRDNSSNETGFGVNLAGVNTGISTAANTTTITTSTYGCLTNNGQVFGIVANNATGSTASNMIALQCVTTPPTAPTLLSVTGTNTSITLTWRDNSTNEADFALLKGGVFTGVTTSANTTTVTTLTYGCIANNGQSFSIAARNAQGSVTSNSLPLTCPTIPPVASPTSGVGGPQATNTPKPTAKPTVKPTATTVPNATNTPKPTAKPVATAKPTTPSGSSACACQSNLSCSSSCQFDKQTGDTRITYANPIKCSMAVQKTPPSQNIRDSWCGNRKRTRGDADGDGKVSAKDYYWYRRLVRVTKPVPTDINADFNGDREVGTIDAIILLKTLRRLK